MNLSFKNSPLAPQSRPDLGAGSFLPEEFVRRKRERRSNFIALVLFCIVMFGVVAAFFVTHRQWNSVKSLQQDINAQYTAEGRKIDQLKVLEAQKQEMLEKADITAALLERVPRSILMAEIINRMPEQLTLTDLKLMGKRLKEAPAMDTKEKLKQAAKPKSLAGAAAKDKEPERPKPTAPKFDFTIELVGLAAADDKVADYQASLKQCPLLDGVDLVYTGAVKVDDVERRKFRIEARIKATADARNIQPLQVPRGGAFAGKQPQMGPDGKPMPNSPSWVRRFGLTGSKLEPKAPDAEGEEHAQADQPAAPASATAPQDQPEEPMP
ncbi:MAG: PilN domain-containing protein [Phycisphaeraceae bacterium]|nr:PilN domain-containing protein [Phycisphaeraceae bacterium]